MKKESWLALALLSAAFFSRVVALNGVPLAADEAGRAWASWRAIHGGPWPEHGSMLLLNGNALLFLLFGAGDGIARLLPSLAGVLLVGLPWLWRKRIGTIPALAASALLLLSPIALAVSRHLEGTALAALAVALLATALWAEVRRPTALIAAGWALGLTAGPRFWDGLLAMGVASFFVVPPHARRALLLRGMLYGSIAAWLLCIAFGLHPEGWAGPMVGLAAWLHPWGLFSWEAFRGLGLMLLLAEPLVLLLALYALLRKRDRSQHHPWLVFWIAATLVLLLAHGAEPRALALLLFPLALLAGEGASALRERGGGYAWPGPFIQELAYVVLGLFAWLLLARATTYLATGHELWLALVVGMLSGLLYTGFVLSSEAGFAERAFVRGVGALFLLFQAGMATTFLSGGAVNPAEPLSQPVVSPDVRSVVTFARDYSRCYAITPERLTIAIVGPVEESASILWALRDFPAAYATPALPSEAPNLLITPQDLAPRGEGWDGMRFSVAQSVSLHFADSRAFLRWLFYRLPPAPVEWQQWILWWHRSGT